MTQTSRKHWRNFWLLILGGALALLFVPALGGGQKGAPPFAPQQFFNGKLSSWGVFQDPLGRTALQFTMHADANWQGNTGMMHEQFVFSDGSKKERFWTFRMTDASHFIGTAPDVDGEAEGVVRNNALHWIYTIRMPINGHDIPVRFDDWLYPTDAKHLFSKVHIRKWGLPVGELTMFFAK